MHHLALLGACPETPEYEQFNSTREEAKEDEGDATSTLDAKLNISMGEEMDTVGAGITHPWLIGTAEGTAPCKGSITECAGNSLDPRLRG